MLEEFRRNMKWHVEFYVRFETLYPFLMEAATGGTEPFIPPSKVQALSWISPEA